MVVQDVINMLVYGELSQHYMANNGELNEDKIPVMISHINLGLTALHKRFPLRKKIETYVIDQLDTVIDLRATVPDLLKIEGVSLASGKEMVINETKGLERVSSFDWFNIKFEGFEEGTEVLLEYRLNHPRIASNADLETTSIILPDSFIEPLITYVASRVVSSIGFGEAINEASFYASKFEMLCLQLENKSMINGDGFVNNRLESKGWV